MYSTTSSLADPPVHNPIADGVAWVQGAAIGSVATTVAVVAVAAMGLLMLSGRLELRRGLTLVLGCFILFGAGSIGTAITGGTIVEVTPTTANAWASRPLTSTTPAAGPSETSYDPYAGASVPFRR